MVALAFVRGDPSPIRFLSIDATRSLEQPRYRKRNVTGLFEFSEYLLGMRSTVIGRSRRQEVFTTIPEKAMIELRSKHAYWLSVSNCDCRRIVSIESGFWR